MLTFKADIRLLIIFALIFRTSWPKMVDLDGKIGEGVVQYWPLTNSFFLLGVGSYVCANFGENRSRNATVRVLADGQTDRHTDTQTHTQTQTDFIICPMLYAIAMGQINITHRINRNAAPINPKCDHRRCWRSHIPRRRDRLYPRIIAESARSHMTIEPQPVTGIPEMNKLGYCGLARFFCEVQ